MSVTFSEVDVSDAENIAQYVQMPAMHIGPIYQMMFNTIMKVMSRGVITGTV